MEKKVFLVILSLFLAFAIIACTPEMAQKLTEGIPAVDPVDPNKDAKLFDIDADGAISLKEGATVPQALLIPEKVDEKEVKSVKKCTGSFTSVTIPGHVETIDVEAFKDCDKLETLVIEDGVELIDENAFGACTALKMIIINSEGIKIDTEAFPNLSSETEFWYMGKQYEDITAIRKEIAKQTGV